MGETLLDLSDWPAAPQRNGLPPRPAPGSRRRLRLTGTQVALGALGLGAALLLVPTGGCGPALGAWAARPLPVPADVPPALDDAETRGDAAAVAEARTALAAWHPATRTTMAPSTSTRTVSAVDPREVAADKDALDAAQGDATSAQHDLDDLLAEQEASDDPGQYDGQVAAAREELDRAVARVDEATRALAAAKARTRTVTVTSTAAPRPTATASTARTALVAQLREAQQVQAAHLASRAQVVSDWRTGHEQQVVRVSAHNTHVTTCARRAALPASTGAGLVVLGGGLLLRRRLTSRR